MSELHIVIPIINQVFVTKRALDTIKTRHTYQIHIIDQDSDQETQSWLSTWQNSKDRWVHRCSPKVSLSAAWNLGVIEALKDSGVRYFFIVNNDVLLHAVTIDNLIDSLYNTGYAMVTCNNVAPKMDEPSFANHEVEGSEADDLVPISNWREEGPDFSGFLINKQTIRDIGWFDENYSPAFYEDNDYHTRILKAGKHAKRIARAPFYHFGSLTASAVGVSSGFSQGRFVEKWGVMPEKVMDGQGFATPYNEADKDWRYWRGCEKYNQITV